MNLQAASEWTSLPLVVKFPVIAEYLAIISEEFNLVPIPSTIELIRKVDFFAHQGTNGWSWGNVPDKKGGVQMRGGAYISMSGGTFTLILFILTLPGFMKQGTDICWRAYLITREGKIIRMTPKEDGAFNSYRQIASETLMPKSVAIGKLLADIHNMCELV